MKKLTFWSRWRGMFQTDFVDRVQAGSSGSWKFWWVSNTLLAVVMTVVLAIAGHIFLTQWITEQLDHLPADAAITMTDAQLSTSGIPDPMLWAPEDSKNEFVVVLDTTGETYEPSVLDDYKAGFLMSRDFFVSRENNVSKMPQQYAELLKKNEEESSTFDQTNWTLTRADVVRLFHENFWKIELVGVVMLLGVLWFWLAILRLVWAVLWGAVLWGVGAIAGLKNWQFEHAFSVVQHWLLPLFLLDGVLELNAVDVPVWARGVVLLLALGANIWQMRQPKKS